MPSTRAVPPSGRCSPARHSIPVVLPAPLGPRTTVICPAEADHVMASRAVTGPKRRTSSSAPTAASPGRSRVGGCGEGSLGTARSLGPVSYTHLDVYKRQTYFSAASPSTAPSEVSVASECLSLIHI